MTFNLTVVSPINKTSSITGAGTTEKMIVRLRVPDGSMKNPVDGIALRDGSEIAVIITDPAKFSHYTPGQTVAVSFD